MKIIAQVLGILGMCLALLSFQQKNRRRILILQFCADILFTTHFLLLGAVTGCMLNGIGIVRAAIFANRQKKWASHIAWPILFCLFFAGVYGANFLFFGMEPTAANLLIEALPTLGMFSTTIAFRMKKAAQVRVFSLISSPLWLAYNIINGSVGGILTEVFSILSIFIGILRLDLKKKNPTSPKE